MPQNQIPTTPGQMAIMRARNALGRAGGAVRDFASRQIEGVRNSVPGTANHDWRQTFDALPGIPGNWFDSRTGRWVNPLTGRPWRGERPQLGAPLAASQPPLRDVAPAPTPSASMPALPNWSDPNQMGPPATSAGPTPMPRVPVTPAGPVGAQRSNRTIATGQAAQNFARSIGHANSGLGASSFGRDQLMQTNREG